MQIQIDGVTYYDNEEVAKALNCSTRTVMRYREAGRFNARNINRSWFFTEQSVIDYLEKHGTTKAKKGGGTNGRAN